VTTAGRLAARIEAELREHADPVRGVGAQRYLKIELECLGCGAAAIRSAAAGVLRDEPGLDRRRMLALVRALWVRPVWDLRAAATVLLERRAALLAPADLVLLERLIRDSGTWALVDELAVHAVGPLVARHPRLEARLDRWVRDDDFWVRRASLLAHLLPLRRGAGDFDRFARRADRLLEEREFFIRKAIGWVLRDTSRRRPREVAAWLLPRAARASGLTVREATKHLPARERAAILAAHADGKAPRGRAVRAARRAAASPGTSPRRPRRSRP
jgi:3-methyladenine DNA glycosylase AlkD